MKIKPRRNPCQRRTTSRQNPRRAHPDTRLIEMTVLTQLVKLIAILAAAALLGNWFLSELRAARRNAKPWYAVYLTPPGILVILSAIILPIAVWYFKHP
jgi:hypothetical protein